MHKGISIKVVWYGLIVLVALVPVAILFPWLGSKAHTLLLESALLREARFNEVIKTHLDHEVGRIITLLQNKSDPMAYTLAGTVDKDLLNGLLDAVISREDAVHVLALVDRQGRLLVGKDRHGHSLRATVGSGEAGGQKEGQAGREPLFDPQGPEVVIPMHGRTYTGSPFIQEGEWNFYLAVPVGPPNHRPLAVLLVTIDAGKFWQGIQAQLSRPGVSTYLVDSRGSLLAPPAGSTQPAGALLSHMAIVRSLIARKDWVKTDTYIGLNGLSSFGTATLIDSLNWGVISEIPASTITGPIAATLVNVAVIAAVLAVVFGALGLGLVNRMLRPMSELSGAFDRVAQGDYSKDIPSSPVKEFNTLSTGFNRMINERKQAEQELEKHRDHLEELVEERTNELHKAQEDLLRKERLATLGQLTASVSHELRNPLGTLRNSLFNVTDKLKGKKLGIDQALARMGRSISRCDEIINEMLDFTRARALELKSVAIDDWLSELLDEQIPPQNIAVYTQLAAGVSLDIDAERLRRAIINVFDNACQALQELPKTQKRVGEIGVQTTVEDKRLLISVTDNGPGITGDVLAHIFEPLYSTKGFGVGLGLPIVKQIMERHGGGVDISSEQGQGTKVVLWLPLLTKRQSGRTVNRRTTKRRKVELEITNNESRTIGTSI